jgi:hypothetical protein
MTPTGEALSRQFQGAFGGLRDVIGKLPEAQWYVGRAEDQIPARRAHHAIMWAGRYCRPLGGPHPAARGSTPETTWRSRTDMLAYLDETARQIETALDGTTEAQFAGPGRGGHSLLEHWIYNLRHLQHHVGQLSSTLRELRLPAMKWH